MEKTMVDLSKIRVGDEVTIRARVGAKFDNGDFWLGFSETGSESNGTIISARVCPLSIATHTPAPREFKPGDKVIAKRDKAEYELVGIRERLAFLWYSPQCFGRTADVSDLCHADDPA
jgi:hypothetical protein